MNFLFTLLIFSIPLGVISRTSVFPNVYLYLHDIFAAMIFLVLIYKVLWKKNKIIRLDLLKAFMAFIIIGLFSLILNIRFLNLNSFLASILYLFRYLVYGSLIFSTQFLNKEFIKGLHQKLVLSGFIFLIFGFIQYFYYTNLRNLFYAGWDEHLYRLFSTMLDPNFAGAFLVINLFLVLAGAFVYWRKKKMFIFALFTFDSLLTLMAIFLTYSRSAFISLTIGFIVLMIVIRKVKFIFPLLLLMVLLLIIFSNSKVEGMNPLRIVSSEARLMSASEAISIFAKNPVIGVGFNSYRYAQVRYGYRVPLALSNSDAGTDNSFLFILATTGIVGLGSFTYFLFILAKSITSNVSWDNVLSVSAPAVFFALLFNSLFINTLFYSLILAYFLILIGSIVNKKQ